MRWIWVTTNWDDPFPLESLNKFAAEAKGLPVFVVEAHFVNGALNWVFSDEFLGEFEAASLIQRSLDTISS